MIIDYNNVDISIHDNTIDNYNCNTNNNYDYGDDVVADVFCALQTDSTMSS